jgi:hypothetical protein
VEGDKKLERGEPEIEDEELQDLFIWFSYALISELIK